MKRLFSLAVALVACVSTQAVWFSSAPGSVDSGQGYWVSADESPGGNSVEVWVYKNGSYFAYGNGWGYASAGGSTTDYGVQTVTYEAYSSWYDDWWNYYGDYTSTTVNIIQPNNAPTIEWVQNPGSAQVNQWFAVQARGTDPDGNLMNVIVWREWVPFAYNGGGNGYENYTDANLYAHDSPGSVTFMAASLDSNYAESPVIYHTVTITENNAINYNSTNWPTTAYMNQGITFSMNVTNSGTKYWGGGHFIGMRDWNANNIYFPSLNGWTPGTTGDVSFSYTTPNLPGTYPYNFQALEHMVEYFGPHFSLSVEVINRAPVNPTISSGGVTQINLGQSVTLTGTLQDPDGNLAFHNLYYAAPGGNFTGILSGTPSGGGYSSISTTYTPNAPGVWQFRTLGHDNYDWSPNATLSVTVVDVTAPTVPGSLSASGNTTGNSFTLNWAASTDNVGVTAYEVMRDTTSLGTTSATSLSVTGLTQGATYAMKVRARDAAGNWSAWSGILNVTTPDLTAPSIPNSTTFSVTANTTGNSFTLSWTASTDNIGVTGYEVMRDTTLAGSPSTASLSVTGLTQATTYAMKVRARDAAGNWSAWSNVVNVSTPDVTAPSVPTGLASASVTNTNFTLNWSASTDNVGVTAYEVMRGTTNLGSAAPTSRAITGLMPGTTYAMKVRARDAAGNWSTWSSILNVTTTALPNVDSDGDGVSDLIEQQLGTNPNAAAQADTNGTNQLKIHRPNQ
ncbi:MAG: fibronectin type III domain-containing protein [Opitutaceae bacterium]|nr:fibronectin type III domain-containing protein [Opitutaceae bacterium]